MTKDATAEGVAATGKATKAGAVGLTSTLTPFYQGFVTLKIWLSIGGANARTLTAPQGA